MIAEAVPTIEGVLGDESPAQEATTAPESGAVPEVATKRGRGRPRKQPAETTRAAADVQAEEAKAPALVGAVGKPVLFGYVDIENKLFPRAGILVQRSHNPGEDVEKWDLIYFVPNVFAPVTTVVKVPYSATLAQGCWTPNPNG